MANRKLEKSRKKFDLLKGIIETKLPSMDSPLPTFTVKEEQNENKQSETYYFFSFQDMNFHKIKV